MQIRNIATSQIQLKKREVKVILCLILET